MLDKSGVWVAIKISFGLGAILAPVSLGLRFAGNPEAAFAAGGAAAMLFLVALILVVAWSLERVRLLWRYQQLRQNHLVHWTDSAGGKGSHEVFIGLDAASFDGNIITWNGLTQVLTDVVWLGRKASTIEFRVALHHFRYGHVGDEELQIPVPAEHKEDVRRAVERIRTTPANSSIRQVYVLLYTIMFVAALAMFLARVS